MDRIENITKRTFRKFLWICPVCQVEEMEDRDMAGGQSYEHTCKNGHKFNQSAGHMKEFNHCLTYTTDEYEKLSEQEIADKKQVKFDEWVYEIKHPKPYIEPTPEMLQQEIDSKLQEIQSLEARKVEAINKEVSK